MTLILISFGPSISFACIQNWEYRHNNHIPLRTAFFKSKSELRWVCVPNNTQVNQTGI